MDTKNTKEMVTIQNVDGTTMDVELVTYLVSEDRDKTYLVYSKGEKTGEEMDEVIYISRIVSEDGALMLDEIVDSQEWEEVQKYLKRIANA